MIRRAFTLIELLVVIAIIAVLAAILFPVFAQAKAAAKNAGSIANLKQLVTAGSLYLNDNDDRHPNSRYKAVGQEGAEWIWPFLYAPYTKNPPRDLGADRNTLFWSPTAVDQPQYLAGYARVAKVVELGLDKQFNLKLGADPAGQVAFAFWSSYAINETVVEEYPNASEYAEPSDTFWFLEAQDTEVETDEVLEIYGRTVGCPSIDASKLQYEMHTPRGGHAGGSNFAWIDGHVTHRKLVPSPRFSDDRRWCDAAYWVFPEGFADDGDDNCGQWTAPADYRDPADRTQCLAK